MNQRIETGKPKRPRVPLQPEFKFWPWGVGAALLPLVGILLAWLPTVPARLEFPNWIAGGIFFMLIGGGNGYLLSRAVRREHSHARFGFYCAIRGAFSVCIFLVPGAVEVYLAFLAVFIVARLIARIGVVSLIFLCLAVVSAIIFLPIAAKYLATGVEWSLDSGRVHLASGLFAACPLTHSFITGALPAEDTKLGRLDATITGVSASLIGMFFALGMYRTALLAVTQSAEFIGRPVSGIMQFCIAAAALAAGNAVLVWVLFRTAYIARPEREVASAVE